MPAGPYDFDVEQGATLSRIFSWEDENGDPVPLLNYTARMQVRAEVSSEDVTLELTTENDRISLGDADGSITLTVDADDMSAIDPGNYVYDLELASGATPPFVTRLLSGRFSVSPEVTRAAP